MRGSRITYATPYNITLHLSIVTLVCMFMSVNTFLHFTIPSADYTFLQRANEMVLRFNETIVHVAMASSVCWYGHVLRREGGREWGIAV